MNKKNVELTKYIEKKRKQKSRDEIMAKIVELSRQKPSGGISLIKKKIKEKIRQKEEDEFEKRLFENSNEDSTDTDFIDSCNLHASTGDSSCEDSDTDRAISFGNQGDTNHLKMNEAMIQEDVSVPVMIEDTNVNDLQALKERILGLCETFQVNRCSNRLESVQEQRRKLDIFHEEAEIITEIKHNLITFIQGETGCGKTTQIPQFLLENGFTGDRIIAVTQPRRFSAISISERINYETNEKICGYKIKYENTVTEKTKIKVLTEGVLFREIQVDFLLKEYSVIVLDEVHERSTNIDILIGLLSKIIKIRFDQGIPLRLVLMSATVDPERFKSVLGVFKTLVLTGKMYPVSVFFEDKTPEDYLDSAFKKILAILQSESKIRNNKKTGMCLPNEITNNASASILVFLTSKEDIYTLKSRLDSLNKQLIVLPLHSGQSRHDQAKIYEKYPARKIILATNIAETSITIEDIVIVIDCGRVKTRVADQNTVMYRICFVSKSSAKQRAGRAGRTGPGVCYRLYSGDTFEGFDEHNTPQILIEPLDSYFLQLKNLGIKNLFGFPFIDQPSEETIEESLSSLESIGALDSNWNVTKLGKRMCAYPIKPRYSRLLILKSSLNTKLLHALVVIISILSCEFEVKISESTKVYFDGAKSDLIVYLKIYSAFECCKDKRALSSAIGISIDRINEIKKMARYLIKIVTGEAPKALETLELTGEEEDEISRLLYCMFADQIAICTGSKSYLFKDGDIFISNDSIDTKNSAIVFDHIVCGAKRCYAKNVTVIPTEMGRQKH